MKKLLPIFLLITLVLALASCGGKAEPTAAPTDAPTSAPTDAPSTEPTAEPSTEPSTAPQQASTPVTTQIVNKWNAAQLEEDYPLRPDMMAVDSDLFYARSSTAAVDADPPLAGRDYLIRYVGGGAVYEIAAIRPWYDEEGIETLTSEWQPGPNGAGVDIETADAMCEFIVAHPEFLPVAGARYVGTPVVLTTKDDRSVVFAQVRTAQAHDYVDEEYADMQVFLAVPVDTAKPTYSGGYSVLMYDEGYGWSTPEG